MTEHVQDLKMLQYDFERMQLPNLKALLKKSHEEDSAFSRQDFDNALILDDDYFVECFDTIDQKLVDPNLSKSDQDELAVFISDSRESCGLANDLLGSANMSGASKFKFQLV